MKAEAAIALVLVMVVAGYGAGYFVGASSQRTTTAVLTTTLQKTTTSLSTLTTATTLEKTASVAISNASVPASAWSRYNLGGNMMQCGNAQPTGSGWITLTNTGSASTTVESLVIYLGYNTTEYPATSGGGESCAISPSGSLTVYFTLYGSTPAACDPYNVYLSLGNGYDLAFSGSIGPVASCSAMNPPGTT